MARTTEQILRDQIGNLVIQLASLQATNEELREQLALVKHAGKDEAGSDGDV